MVFVIDGLLLLVLIISAYKGYKKGFVDVAISFGSIFVIIFLIWIFASPVTNIILKNKNVQEIEKNLSFKIGEILEKEENKDKTDLNKKEENNKKDNEILNLVLKMNMSEEEKDNIPDYAAKKLIRIMIKVCVSIVLYIVFSVIFLMLNKLLTKTLNTFELSSTINKTGGLILNFAKTFIVVYLLLFAIKMLSPIIPEKFTKIINDTLITKEIYDSDYLVNKVMGVKK